MSVRLPGNDVSTATDDGDSVAMESSKIVHRNHYDDPKLSKQAEKDLPMNPGEDCAMFFGLEVLDASQYQVVGTGNSKRLVISEDVSEEHAASDTNPTKCNDDENKEKASTKPRKKRKQEKPKATNNVSAQIDDWE